MLYYFLHSRYWNIRRIVHCHCNSLKTCFKFILVIWLFAKFILTVLSLRKKEHNAANGSLLLNSNRSAVQESEALIVNLFFILSFPAAPFEKRESLQSEVTCSICEIFANKIVLPKHTVRKQLNAKSEHLLCYKLRGRISDMVLVFFTDFSNKHQGHSAGTNSPCWNSFIELLAYRNDISNILTISYKSLMSSVHLTVRALLPCWFYLEHVPHLMAIKIILLH